MTLSDYRFFYLGSSNLIYYFPTAPPPALFYFFKNVQESFMHLSISCHGLYEHNLVNLFTKRRNNNKHFILVLPYQLCPYVLNYLIFCRLSDLDIKKNLKTKRVKPGSHPMFIKISAIILLQILMHSSKNIYLKLV